MSLGSTVTMSTSAGTTIIGLGSIVFLCIWVAAIYSWAQVIKHRRPDLRWWGPIWSTKDVQPEGRAHFRRFIILIVAGFVTVLAMIALDAAVRSS